MSDEIIHEWEDDLQRYKIVLEKDDLTETGMGYHFYDSFKNSPELGWDWNENDITDELARLAERVKQLEAVARYAKSVMITRPYSDDHMAAVMNLIDALEKAGHPCE